MSTPENAASIDSSYAEKWERIVPGTLFDKLDPDLQVWLKEFSFRQRLTFQELRILSQALRESAMWGEASLPVWLGEWEKTSLLKKNLFRDLENKIAELKNRPHDYSTPAWRPKPDKLRFEPKADEREVFGMCPAESKKTVCCNLRTIDAVQGCGFGCSYCTIQTFYQKTVTFDPHFKEKLARIRLEPGRRYHIGTGQASDSLIWGNREGILDALMDFARERPNILLEFKTKSKNTGYFLDETRGEKLPPNLVLTWSMNPEKAVDHEEHFTANTEERLEAARSVADRGIPVGFHFHPMIWYEGWENDYAALAREVTARFRPEEVLFVSIGSLTFIKPVIRQIRERGIPSKILQMEFVENPDGKLTYPDRIKEKMFRHLYEALSPWHGKVFTYLCMEKKEFWYSTFGRSYETNELFEEDFLDHSFAKIEALKKSR